jgi:hypothetical protein
MQGFPNGAPDSISHYEALLQLAPNLEATCHGQVGAQLHAAAALQHCGQLSGAYS